MPTVVNQAHIEQNIQQQRSQTLHIICKQQQESFMHPQNPENQTHTQKKHEKVVWPCGETLHLGSKGFGFKSQLRQ